MKHTLFPSIFPSSFSLLYPFKLHLFDLISVCKTHFWKMGPKAYHLSRKKKFIWALTSLKNFWFFPKWYTILIPVHYKVAVNCLTAGSAECLAGRAVLNLPIWNGRTFKVAVVSRTELSAGFTTWAPAQLLSDTVRYELKKTECLLACRASKLAHPHMQPCKLSIYWYFKILVWGGREVGC